jgi:hypothetical protein
MEIKDFLSDLNKNWHAFAVHPQRAFADFFNGKTAFWEKWMTGEALPAGEEKLQILFFLEQYGHQAEDLQNTADLVKQLCELIAFGVITQETIKDCLGYSENNYLINRMLGKSLEIPNHKQNTAREIIAESQKALAEKKKAFNQATLPVESKQFFGSWEKCLADLAGRMDISFLPPLIGVQPIAVKEWLNGTYKPRGKNYAKLLCVLTGLGYEVEELAKLSTVLKKLTQIIGFDILTPKDVNSELGYNEEKAIYRLLNLEMNLSDDKKPKVERLVAEWESLVHEKILELNFPQICFQPIKKILDSMPGAGEEKYVPVSADQAGIATEGEKPAEKPAVVAEKPTTPVVKTRLEMEQEKTGKEMTSHFPKEKLIEMAAHLIDVALPILELLASDKTTSEEREALRDAVQAKNGVFRLSNAATMLCGEKIREQKK